MIYINDCTGELMYGPRLSPCEAKALEAYAQAVMETYPERATVILKRIEEIRRNHHPVDSERPLGITSGSGPAA